MTMKNSFSQNTPPTTPVIGNVTGSTMPKQADAAVPEIPKVYEIDTVQLFEKAFTLAISQGSSYHGSPNFWIEVEETDTYQSVVINAGDKGETVFYARRLNNAASPSQKHKVLCLRPGKWAEYFMETYCPAALAKNFEKLDDAEVDYAAVDAQALQEAQEAQKAQEARASQASRDDSPDVIEADSTDISVDTPKSDEASQ